VITLNVVQSGGVFELDGFDDECGAPLRGAVDGTAFQNLDGSIGMGLTVVTSGGQSFHLDATIGISTLSGTWRTDTNASGAWVFTPGPGQPGSARPAPSTTVVIDSPGRNLPATLVDQFGFDLLEETVVTPKTGRLSINKSVRASINCGGAPEGYLFLILDGVPLRNSVVYTFEIFQGVLTGVTLNPTQAGPHVVGVGGQCFSGSPAGGSYATVTISSVTVLP
jgi:hypothetical protein